MVRFADSMGLDLEHIRHILVDDYTMVDANPDPHPLNSSIVIRAPRTLSASSSSSNCRYLVKRFNLPNSYNIPKLVDAKKVCLESLTILDLSLTGVIRVANVAFEKQVHVRYTLDGWATWTEVRASFIDSSSNGAND
uniref:CBM21 domain-containing protein n=1 Tax=Plectus sambesii TaxID=2011161 RepID=A0A914V6E5_9BILA